MVVSVPHHILQVYVLQILTYVTTFPTVLGFHATAVLQLEEAIELQLLQASTEESIFVGTSVKPTQKMQLEVQSSPRSPTNSIHNIFAYMLSALGRRRGNAPSSPTWTNPQVSALCVKGL